MPWLRWLFASVSPWRPGFNLTPVHVEPLLATVVLGQVLFSVLAFPLTRIISPVIHIYSFIYCQFFILVADDGAVK